MRGLAVIATLALLGAMPRVRDGFTMERIAVIDGARELAIARNGDMFVGTEGDDVYVVPSVEAVPGEPSVFASFDDAPAAGVALGDGALFVGTQFGVYRIAYTEGDRVARGKPVRIASVRTSGISGNHRTTSVAYRSGSLFVGIGSSCNACKPETDATRASIEKVDVLAGNTMHAIATGIRNPIALAIDPLGDVWAGVAGADDLPVGHPYEIFDDVAAHPAPVDYGWPSCYENRRSVARWAGDCSRTAIPLAVFPAYDTPIGAAFYPLGESGRYAFPKSYRGGAFVTLHGSWHGPAQGLSGFVPPRVVFVPMRDGRPSSAVAWDDPTVQWQDFIGGFQSGGSLERIGRPTGVAVGPQGSLFVADDFSGAIYRIRPNR